MSIPNAKAKFFLFVKQSSEGCDYTIGCALNLISLKAQTLSEARDEALEEVGEDGSSELALSSAILIEAARAEVIDVAAHYERKATERRLERRRSEEEADRLEYERLRQKFGQ